MNTQKAKFGAAIDNVKNSVRRCKSHCSHSNTPYLTEHKPTGPECDLRRSTRPYSGLMGRNSPTLAWEFIPKAYWHTWHPLRSMWGATCDPFSLSLHISTTGQEFCERAGSCSWKLCPFLGLHWVSSCLTPHPLVDFVAIHAQLLPPLHTFFYIIPLYAHGITLVSSMSVMLTRQQLC